MNVKIWTSQNKTMCQFYFATKVVKAADDSYSLACE